MTTVKTCAALALLALSGALTAAQVDAQQTGSYEWLVSHYAPSKDTIVAVASPGAVVASRVQDEPRYKVGISIPVNVNINLGAVSASQPPVRGGMRIHKDGFDWSTTVMVPGASSLRVGLSGLDLAEGAALYIYNDHGHVDGPYTGTDLGHPRQFFTRALPGERMRIQVHYRGDDTEAALRSVRFDVTEIAHLDERFIRGWAPLGNPARAHCSNLNASCVENAECDLHPPGADPVIQALRDASAHMLFQSGASWYICSGGLIESLDGTTGHFLTANHCISTEAEASTLETYFHFTTPCPPGGLPTSSCDYADGSNSSTPSIAGATIVDTSATTDFTLLKLSGSLPPGTVHLPFSTTPVANTNGETLYRISYPSGAPQALSHHEVDAGFNLCGTPGNFIYSVDLLGATEGGSSGSPIVNDGGEIVGQLYGACGTNTGDECDTVNNRTYDGAFSATWANSPLVRNALAQEPLPTTVTLASHDVPALQTGQTWETSFDNGAGHDNLTFHLFGPNGDGDLYVRFGTPPTLNDWDCRPYLNGTDETCVFDPAQTGTYYVMVNSFSTFSDANLTITTNCSDSDGDNVCDIADNCVLVPNSEQCDTNGDGFGNHCDADLDNNGTVNSFDLTIMRNNFGATGANDADLDCNNVVNSFDLTQMRNSFGSAPGSAPGNQ